MTAMKCKCKVCGATEADAEFYKGFRSYCKEHWKERVRNNRAANSDYYKEFDRNRANLPHRIKARKDYQETDAFKKSHLDANRRYRDRNTSKSEAHYAVSNAIRDGRLQRLPCFICGANAEAHHPDYSNPLAVVWLCDEHHKQTHREFNQIKRRKAA